VLYDDLKSIVIKEYFSLISEYEGGDYSKMNTDIHGISRYQLMNGRTINDAMLVFVEMLNSCDLICSHNNSFDITKIVKHLMETKITYTPKPRIDTVNIGGCRISLDDLYKICTGENRDNKHRVRKDVYDLITCWNSNLDKIDPRKHLNYCTAITKKGSLCSMK